MNTDAFLAAVEEVAQDACAYNNAAAVVPPENRSVSAAWLRANGFDLEV